MTGTMRPPRDDSADEAAGGRELEQPFTVEPGQRKIRSFVLRQGRFSPAQQRAFDELWPRFGLDYAGTVRDYDAAFGRAAKDNLAPCWRSERPAG